MDIQEAIIAFDALSQETRLRAFRLLVEHGTAGLPAGRVGDELGVPANTMSFHLSHMANAGLVTARREGRSIIYCANFAFFTGLIRYMAEDCCRVEFARLREDGKKGGCTIEIAGCCPPQKKEKAP